MMPSARTLPADLSTLSIHHSRSSIHDFPELCAPVVDIVWKLGRVFVVVPPTLSAISGRAPQKGKPLRCPSAIGQPGGSGKGGVEHVSERTPLRERARGDANAGIGRQSGQPASPAVE